MATTGLEKQNEQKKIAAEFPTLHHICLPGIPRRGIGVACIKHAFSLAPTPPREKNKINNTTTTRTIITNRLLLFAATAKHVAQQAHRHRLRVPRQRASRHRTINPSWLAAGGAYENPKCHEERPSGAGVATVSTSQLPPTTHSWLDSSSAISSNTFSNKQSFPSPSLT